MIVVERTASKVPEVTLVFWLIKIAATTLGETGGDTVTMTLNWGYLLGTALFLSLLVIFVILQIAAKKFHPSLYWATIVASTTAGTTMADFADDAELGLSSRHRAVLIAARHFRDPADRREEIPSLPVLGHDRRFHHRRHHHGRFF